MLDKEQKTLRQEKDSLICFGVKWAVGGTLSIEVQKQRAIA